MEDILPDVIISKLICFLSPITLYYIYLLVNYTREELEILYNSQDQIRKLLGSKFIVHLLCQEHELNQVDTFDQFLDLWDFWNIDSSVITPEYFSRRNKIPPYESLKICGRNACKDRRWLIEVNRILNRERLWCDEAAIVSLCEGLIWSESLTSAYTTELICYHNTRGCKEKQLNIRLDCYDFHAFKQILPEMSRNSALQNVVNKDDYRLQILLNVTVDEIYEYYNGDIYGDKVGKYRYFHKLGVDASKLDYGLYYSSWVNLFEKREIYYVGTYGDTENYLLWGLYDTYEHMCSLYMEYCKLGLPFLKGVTVEFLSSLTDAEIKYSPYYIKFFVEALGQKAIEENPEFKGILLRNLRNLTRGDNLMTEWLGQLEYLK